MITRLEPNQVFVFGSNATGFHGAGAAGLACRGDARNNWRSDTWFLKALESPTDSPLRIGKWAVLGQARGLQQGREGKSYAIVTVSKAGQKRSVPLDAIKDSLVTLFQIATRHPQYEFLFTPIGAGLAGYSNEEMATVLISAAGLIEPPLNIVFPQDIYGIDAKTLRS